MTKRRYLENDVFQTSIQRVVELYENGDRLVVGFSAGKDSGVLLEVTRIAAKIAGVPQIDVFMADDEIMLPGTFEYAERVANLPDVKFYWMSARQAMPNVYNRAIPYWWVFDWKLDPSEWVRQPPSCIEWSDTIDLYNMISPKRFPPEPGKRLISLLGSRATESVNRMLSIHSAGGFLNHIPDTYGVWKAKPIYDWNTGDIWKAIAENHWDYNHAYDAMNKMGFSRKAMRIAPPLMTWYGSKMLSMAAKVWPKWFDRVCRRCPGARQVAFYGERAVIPIRRSDETWEQCYQRECVDNAPEWIQTRSIQAREHILHSHAQHSTKPFPEEAECGQCSGTGISSWKQLAKVMYTGDVYSMKVPFLPYIQPRDFRPEDTRIWESRPHEGRS